MSHGVSRCGLLNGSANCANTSLQVSDCLSPNVEQETLVTEVVYAGQDDLKCRLGEARTAMEGGDNVNR